MSRENHGNAEGKKGEDELQLPKYLWQNSKAEAARFVMYYRHVSERGEQLQRNNNVGLKCHGKWDFRESGDSDIKY